MPKGSFSQRGSKTDQDNKRTGQDSDRRREEARDILDRLVGIPFREKEQEFISGLEDRFDTYGDDTHISSKQLFWLRDILEKSS